MHSESHSVNYILYLKKNRTDLIVIIILLGYRVYLTHWHKSVRRVAMAPRRRDGGGDDGDSLEEIEAAEQQLEKLRRQHRMRERNRRQYRDEAAGILARQR